MLAYRLVIHFNVLIACLYVLENLSFDLNVDTSHLDVVYLDAIKHKSPESSRIRYVECGQQHSSPVAGD